MVSYWKDNKTYDSGFLIVKTYIREYHDWLIKWVTRPDLIPDIYALPRPDKQPGDYSIKYRGMDRDELSADPPYDTLAKMRIDELIEEGKSADGLLSNQSDALDVFSYLDDADKPDYEIVWARVAGSPAVPPRGYYAIGFEPTYLLGDHFAPQCDCMLFPRWHGTDDEGTLFLEHFHKLNHYGMFEAIQDARNFVEYYLTFDWTEHDEYVFAEVFVSDISRIPTQQTGTSA
jgi:hypothetical protein